MTAFENDDADKPLASPNRRHLLTGILAAGLAGIASETVTQAVKPGSAAHVGTQHVTDAQLHANIDTLVVIYAENRSFNNLFADFPDLQHPLSDVNPECAAQHGRDGSLLQTLPKTWDGMVPDKQIVEHREFQIGQDALGPLANAPFALSTPKGDPRAILPKQMPNTPASAMDGPVRFSPTTLTPDFWAVNTMLPPYAPTYELDDARLGYANWQSPRTLMPQKHRTIGDMMNAANVDWTWYAGGWNAASKGAGDMSAFPARPNFQPHNQPFNYFEQFAPGTARRDRHLRNGGVGETARTKHFLADAAPDACPRQLL
ncbi:alkaline phosphatase family protein [Sphingobium sp.]|uniref:alkaline phosphatase family protein n=1 Tax=Sphingobium sp. TaxID=1912891 RepID=UPI003B3B6F6B